MQKTMFSTNQTKSNKSNIKHQFPKYTCSICISLLSGTVNINLVQFCLTMIALIWFQFSPQNLLLNLPLPNSSFSVGA